MKFRLKEVCANEVPWPCAVLGWQAREFLFAHDVAFFEDWLAQGFQAGMEFLERQQALRRSLEHVLPNAQSALVVLFPYATGHHIRGAKTQHLPRPPKKLPGLLPFIARYARGRDYHKVVRRHLKKIGQNIQNTLGVEFQWRAITDTAPIFDRAFAQKAGLGFIGKNTLLIRPGLGSYFVIGVLLTTLPADVWAEPVRFHPLDTLDCGSCTRCLDACPTQALVKAHVLDANRCLSYLTIEHRGIIAEEFLPHFAHTLYGCDICQDVCPYQLKTNDLDPLRDQALSRPKKEFLNITPKDIATMSFEQYLQWFSGSAATRARYEGLVRNALYHLYARKDPDLIKIISQHFQNSSVILTPVLEQIEKILSKQKIF